MTLDKLTREDDADLAEPARPSLLARIPGYRQSGGNGVFWWSIALLVANAGLVVTGGAVRVTGSGLGCPTWPQCGDGSFVPHSEMGIHGVIEFGNRMLTWVLTAIAIAAWIAVVRSVRSNRTTIILATLLALGIPFQGVIGGITVLTKLNPWVVALHFLLSMALVSGSTWLAYRVRDPRNMRPKPINGFPYRISRHMAWLAYLATWVTVYLGTVVTGSGPHAGDEEAPRNGLDPDNATQLHADAVFVLVGAALALIIATRAARLPQFRATIVFAAVITVQGVIGFVQFATDLPVALVIAHMLGSAILVIGATHLVLAFGADPDEAADDTETPVESTRPTVH